MATEHLQAITQAGHQAEYDQQFSPGLLKEWRKSPPGAFVVDLSRLPSHGREIAIALRHSPSTRPVPIVFCGGDPEKVKALRVLLPDAAYCELSKLAGTLKKALAAPPKNPVRPTAMMDRYKTRTAAEKLGVRAGSAVGLVNPPRDVERVLGPLPHDVNLFENETGGSAAQVHLCFVHRPDELASMLSRLRHLAGQSKLWILWQKGGKAAAGDVTEAGVRQQALDLGLVDYKICSVNNVWTGMLFAAKRC